MENCGIPLCLPDNFTWDPKTNECKQHGSHRSGTLKVVDTALRQLKLIHGPICVVAIAGPCRQGKSYILSQPFARNRDVFPLGHEMDPKTVGLWMWVVPQKHHDSKGNEFTVVLIDSEGTDSTAANKSDDDMIFTLAVLLSSVLIYNCASVPKRSDLEELSFVLKLSQIIQVFTGKDTTDTQARMVFPSFVWLLRDTLLQIPKDCSDLKEYFSKRVFCPSSSTNPEDKAQQVSNTILKFFPSFDAFSLPLPSTDPQVVQSLPSASSTTSVNPKFREGIERFSEMLMTKLQPKRNPDGNGLVTGEALASMLQTYVETMNTPGAVPSVVGAWDKFIDQKSHEISTIAKVVYFHEMKEHLAKKLPCDSSIITEQHNLFLEHVKFNVFDEAAESEGISPEHLEEYTVSFKVEAEAIENSWHQRNYILTEKDCEKTFEKVKESKTSTQDIWDTCKHPCEAETRIKNECENMIKEFRRQSRGCTEIIEKRAVEYKEEIDKETYHEIAIIRRFGINDDEIYAREVENEERSEILESLKANKVVMDKELEVINDKLQKLELQHLGGLKKLNNELEEELLRDKQRLESQLQQNQADARREQEKIENNNRSLERRCKELEKSMKKS